MDKDKCNAWAKERLAPKPRNPLTNRAIKKDGPTYGRLDKDCKDLIIDIDSICNKWLKDNHKYLYTQLDPLGGKKKPAAQAQPKPAAQAQPKPAAQAQPKPAAQAQPKPAADKYTTDVRKRSKDTIEGYFSSVIIRDGKACMTNTRTLLKYVDNPKLLGYGSYGNVYEVSIPSSGLKVAIKEGEISKKEYAKAMNKQYPKEYLFNKLVNDLIENKTCPNFSYTYVIFFCNMCTLKSDFLCFTVTSETQCSETVMELFDRPLYKLKEFEDEVILSILFQILFAVACIQLKYGLCHHDIKKDNILLKSVPKGGYWTYNIDEKSYYVPNHGYIAALIDFGISENYKPGFTQLDLYGDRPVKVVHTSSEQDAYFIPLPSNRRLVKSVRLLFSDMGTYPVYGFHHDIINTIRTFTGGNMVFPFYTDSKTEHEPMNISQNIHDMLKDFYFVKPDKKWPMNRVDLFLAHYAIEKLFSSYRKTGLRGTSIEEYNLVTETS